VEATTIANDHDIQAGSLEREVSDWQGRALCTESLFLKVLQSRCKEVACPSVGDNLPKTIRTLDAPS
jgi:hypothetical protein